MNDDNAATRVIQDLRERAIGAPAGEQLPSVRELMAKYRTSPITVSRVLRQLVAEGVVETRPGQGTFVAPGKAKPASDMSWQAVALGPRPPGEEAMQALIAPARPGSIPLSSGYLDPELQPVAALGAALARAARQPATWQRGSVEGREDLRTWFATEAGGALRPDDIVICHSGQAALSTAFRALASAGDTVLVESPTYLGALAAARAAGLTVVPVPSDDQGVRPELLDAALQRSGAKLFYCQPLYANPHGAVLATERRQRVLNSIRHAGAFLIEDDYARDLTIDGDPPPPLLTADEDGHVVYLRSLTKSAAPGMRVAAVGARGAAGVRLRTARGLDDFFVAGPMQQAALEFVTSPGWHRHRRALRSALRARRDALVAALHRHLPELEPRTVPKGGLHLWVRLPDGLDDVEVTNAAAAEHVVVFPGRPWYAAEPEAPHLRLTYAAAPPDQLAEGVRRLKKAMGA
jgi:DNA-binding transcriptional MocR family regulator